ncbi:MAG: restriction endonuclease subunit S [Candidatus Bathyarchaeia archaeon]
MEEVNKNTNLTSYEGIPFKFYKETNFKEDPEIGKLPEDWEAEKIDELFKVETGTTPSTREASYWDGGNINWFTPMDLSKLNGKILIEESERKITRKALEDCNLTLMPKGSIILSTRAPVGYVAVLEQEGTFNQGCKGLIPKSREKVNPFFYAYYLLLQKQKLENLSGGSTFKELSKTMLENLEVPCPILEEQKRIVEVLSAVDLAIQRVDEAIVRAERLKKGLMQQLLTKGIGHKEFKETPIGKIPKTWEVVKIKEIGDVVTGTTPSTSVTDYWNGKYPFVTPSDFTENKYVYQTARTVTEKGAKKGRIIPRDSIFVVCIGSTLGKVAMSFSECITNQQINAIICDKKVNPHYVYYIMNFKKDELRSWAGTTAKPIVKKSLFEDFMIPLPQIFEQQKTAELLSSVDEVLELKRNRREKLVKIKRRLMDLLLTGRVRVSL